MHIVRNLDEIRWREFINNHPSSTLFHTPEMFKVFERTKGFAPELWAVVDADGQIYSLFLPTKNNILSGVLQYVSTRAVAYGSILCAPGPHADDALLLLLNAYNKNKNILLFTELRNQSDNQDFQNCLNEQGFIFENHLNFLIDLTKPIDEVWRNVRSSARRNVKKAEKSNVIIEEIEDAEDLTEAYQILKKVYSRIQGSLPDKTLFEAGFDILRPIGMMKILLAKLDGVSVGTLTLLMYKGTITYWYTGTLHEFASYRVSDYLAWHAIKYGIEGDFTTFDFGGGGKPDEQYGVRDFKAKYGGELVNYGRNTKIHSPIRFQVSRYGYKVVRKFF